jgi:hypothetical protein
MSKPEREKIMIYARPGPFKGTNLMADSAIFKAARTWFSWWCPEVITVAVDAVNSQNIEPDRIF